MKIRPITNTDIPFVVSLHQQSLPTTTSSRMGTPYLQCLYTGLTRSPHAFLLCATVGEDIVGVITGTTDLKETSAHLGRQLYPAALPVILRALITGRITVLAVLRQLLFERALLRQFQSPYPTILTLFVSPAYRSQGVGKKLLNASTNLFASNGIRTYYVDTEKENTGAQRFYETKGKGKREREVHNAVVFSFTQKP